MAETLPSGEKSLKGFITQIILKRVKMQQQCDIIIVRRVRSP